MDGRRFDDITRRFTRGGSRRQLLLAVSAAAGGLVLGQANRAASQEPQVGACLLDSDCLTPDANPCTGVRCADGRCLVSIVMCVPGFTCCGNGECCPTPAACVTDAACIDAERDPCTGTRCEGGLCVHSIVTCAFGHTCCGNGECCPGWWWPGRWHGPGSAAD